MDFIVIVEMLGSPLSLLLKLTIWDMETAKTVRIDQSPKCETGRHPKAPEGYKIRFAA